MLFLPPRARGLRGGFAGMNGAGPAVLAGSPLILGTGGGSAVLGAAPLSIGLNGAVPAVLAG